MCSRPTDEGSEPGADPSQANINRYRLHLYNYALQAERLRLSAVGSGWGAVCPVYPTAAAAAAAAAAGIYPPRFPVALFHPGMGAGGQNAVDEPKPQHSYIGLIAMAILGSAEGKLVLSDIYQYILDNYPYFRARGPGWRNSIRHNLSLNDCFVKAGRSANGKGHYWAIHPANVDDFKKGDFRRRKAQRKVRRHMGLAVDDDGNDSPSPPPPPPQHPQHHPHAVTLQSPVMWQPPPVPPSIGGGHPSPFYFQPAVMPQHIQQHYHHHSGPIVQARAQKRQFDVASLLAPDPPKRHHLHRNDPVALMTAVQTTTCTTTTAAVMAGGSSDDDDETACSRNGSGGGSNGGGSNGGGGVAWESAGLLQRYYEQQLQAAHRLHAFRQSLGLQRMIGAGSPWPAVIVDRNQTPSPSSLQQYATTTTPDDPIKTELVD